MSDIEIISDIENMVKNRSKLVRELILAEDPKAAVTTKTYGKTIVIDLEGTNEIDAVNKRLVQGVIDE